MRQQRRGRTAWRRRLPQPGRRQGRPRDHMGGGKSRSPGRLSPESGRRRRLQREPRRLLALPPSPPELGRPARQVSGARRARPPAPVRAAGGLLAPGAHPAVRARSLCAPLGAGAFPAPRPLSAASPCAWRPRQLGFPVPGAPPPDPGPRVLWSRSAEGAGTGRAGRTAWAPPGCARRGVHWQAQRSGNPRRAKGLSWPGGLGRDRGPAWAKGKPQGQEEGRQPQWPGRALHRLLNAGRWPQCPWVSLGSTCSLWVSPGATPGWVLGRVVPRSGTAAFCLGWLLTPDVEALEILQGLGLQGHSLAQWRGQWMGGLWPQLTVSISQVSSSCCRVPGSGCARLGR